MSSYEYPEDEFDARDANSREPIGVHRAPVPSWRAWLPLLLVLVLVPCLAWGVVALLGRSGHSASDLVGSGASASASASAAASQEATQEPTEAAPATEAAAEPTQEATQAAAQSADMTTGVTIYNGSKVNGLAGRTSEKLKGKGYTNVTVQQGQYRATEPTVTTVYYQDSSREATAKAVGEALGISNVVESAQGASSNPIVIVLRSDFKE